MKYGLLIIALTVTCLTIGCSKSDTIEPGMLITKWNLVSDSTANSIGAAVAVTNNYRGVAGDYFDFRADGRCYTKEGNVYDTLAYQQFGTNRIAIAKFGFSSSDNPCTIDPFTAHKATITSPALNSPGGYSFRQVSLAK